MIGKFGFILSEFYQNGLSGHKINHWLVAIIFAGSKPSFRQRQNWLFSGVRREPERKARTIHSPVIRSVAGEPEPAPEPRTDLERAELPLGRWVPRRPAQ